MAQILMAISSSQLLLHNLDRHIPSKQTLVVFICTGALQINF
ncbi:unnamed protein product [Toxocara canis]|uniref:Uncharacterized protein n=1 Tax=Toxocara canis TaxID=6265 RepID=A0A3P7F0G8_TOXCA|nr:unnamed protein product [Toxocara canis]